MSRPVVFLVADKNMYEVFKTFLGREGFHYSLGCGAFDFDPAQDLFRHPRNDPGVYNEAHVFLENYVDSHERAVVVLDAAWEGAPSSEDIKLGISANLEKKWVHYEVIVIDPELENWIWVMKKQPDSSLQVHQLVIETLKYREPKPLKEFLQQRGNWREDVEKPVEPKEAVEKILALNNIPRSSALYRKIVKRISVQGCGDPAFNQLTDKLASWFKPEWEQ